MHKYLRKLEHIVDKIIPPILVILLFIIIGDLFFYDQIHPYYHYIEIIDYFIISIFVIDLSFKYHRTKSLKYFLKQYWIDILAVFPFLWFFRITGEATDIIRIGESGQRILHETVEVEKEASVIAKEARGARYLRFARPLARAPRIAKAMVHDKKKLKKIESKFKSKFNSKIYKYSRQ
ncbi:MAG: ion transporter [Candidatus Woesearchaeota archaeon]